MLQTKITIADNGRFIVPFNVSMKPFEIAQLFGVYVQTIRANVKVILKSGIIRADTSTDAAMPGSSIMPEVYGLEMITALAFRIHSPNADKFRSWIMLSLGLIYNPQLGLDLDSPIGLN